MTLTFFFLGSDLFDLNDLSHGEIGIPRTDQLKKNVPYRYQQERLSATFVYFWLLHRRRCISVIWYGLVIALSIFTHDGTLSQPWYGHGPGARHDRVQWNAILLSPMSSLTHSCMWRRRDEEVRKIFTFLWIIFKLSTFIYYGRCVRTWMNIQ